MTSAIISFSDAVLLQLADRIKADLARRDAARLEWIAAMTDLCRALYEARDKFQADQKFHEWLDQNDLGENVLNKDDRASAIAMGERLEEARLVFEATERRSLRLIHREEFVPRFLSAEKPPADSNEAAPAPAKVPIARRRGRSLPKPKQRDKRGGSAPSDQRAAWRSGLDAEQQEIIVSSIKVPAHRAVLDDVPLEIRQKIAVNLAGAGKPNIEARLRDNGRKKVPVFNPRWYSLKLDDATCRTLIVKQAERRWDIMDAAMDVSAFKRPVLVSDMINPRAKAQTMQERYPQLFERPPRNYLERYLGTSADPETGALRDMVAMLVNTFESQGYKAADQRAMLHKLVACLRECTDARSWCDRIWALGDGLVAEGK